MSRFKTNVDYDVKEVGDGDNDSDIESDVDVE